ncbi:N5-glutamine methyltransferase family protein [Aspergillus lucknowensis]|uniref:S-adenosyl-L-methionine-dependent methyltransferase n=1 Tax=Aspergillus lucknowensis TaxID=176173 RepID=A0ABR4LHN8_9EURO
MPRIPTRTILKAYQHDPLLPLLLRECRSLESAKNELRWLRERALHMVRPASGGERAVTKYPVFGWRGLLRSMCLTRSRGMPLQYILGDQPFGDLDIKCARGVLIPRHETETITIHAANFILDRMLEDQNGNKGEKASLHILDLCTGTGCISLLLHALLSPVFPCLSIVGVDIDDAAIRVARENTERNVRLGLLSKRALSEVSFRRGDVLQCVRSRAAPEDMANIIGPSLHALWSSRCDVIISNPPYVSPAEYHDGTTSRSVRIFEPRRALVPTVNSVLAPVNDNDVQVGDLFYDRIAVLMSRLDAKLAVLECGSRLQAVRVATLCRDVLGRYDRTGKAIVDVWPVTDVDPAAHAVFIQRTRSQ